MPTADSTHRYAKSLDAIPTREDLPFVLNARRLFGCGVEVGVQRGLFSAHVLAHWSGAHLISVDPWMEDTSGAYVDIANVEQDSQESRYAETCNRLRAYRERSSVWRRTSVEASAMIPHHSLDFVYLDARHDYESVVEDLEAWFDKVRPGGILAGHDYLDGVHPAGVFGVKTAVDEFFAKRGIPVYATCHDEPWRSWVIEIPLPVAPAAGSAIATPSERVGATISFESNGAAREVKLELDPDQMSQRIMLAHLQRNEMYEPETIGLLPKILREGDTFVDVGAHVGFFSMFAAALVGPGGRVVSFEPEESNYRHVQRHVELNNFGNVDVTRAAVGAEVGTATIWVNADNDGGHALWDVGRHPANPKSREAAQPCTVALTTLDAALADARTPSLIKIDVEGSELRVLRGAERLLRRPVPYVVCEINRFALAQLESTEDQLRHHMAQLGYRTYCIHPANGELVALAPDQHVVGNHVFNLLFRHETAPVLAAA